MSIVICLMALCAAAMGQQKREISNAELFARLGNLDALPNLVDAKPGRFSSNGTTFIPTVDPRNDPAAAPDQPIHQSKIEDVSEVRPIDPAYITEGGFVLDSDCGNFVRRSGNRAVLTEMNGPGCVYRIWSMGIGPKDQLEIYLDGATKPVVETPYIDFFTSPKSFAVSASGMSNGAYYSYAPIPYNKSCKIVIENPSEQIAYNIDYLTFDANTKVRTLTSPPPPEYLKALPACAARWKLPAKERIQRVTGEMTTGGRTLVQPGETVPLLELEGNGRIRDLQFRLQTLDPEAGRKMILRMYWDGETEPSVEAPVYDFFGNGMWTVDYDSAPMCHGTDNDGYHCFLPMPFAKSVRITLENQSDRATSASTNAIWLNDGKTTDGMGRLHALWHRENPTSKTDPWYTAVDIEGRGHLVGVTFAAQNPADSWDFYEGDEVFDIDGTKDAVLGTGIDDYFNRGHARNPFCGSIVDDNATHQTAAYRWHIPDVVPFEKSLRLRFETRTNMEFDYATVCYWYQTEPHKQFAPILAVEKRLHTTGAFRLPANSINAEDCKVVTEPTKGKLFRTKWSEDLIWFDGGAKLEMRTFDPEDSISFAFDAPSEATYDIDLYMLAGPWWARVAFAIDGKKCDGTYEGFLYGFAPRVRHTIEGMSLTAGEHVITLTPAGRMEQAMAYYVGIDYLTLRPRPDSAARQ